jgi:hypothetical protein
MRCCRGDLTSVDEYQEPLDMAWKPKPDFIMRGIDGRWSPQECDRIGSLSADRSELEQFCYHTVAPMRVQGTVERVALFHYAAKSLQGAF